ncbi:MAG TPA: ABC transporter permease [Acidobacteriota bacterium]|nr:ABC transporter permease [Acidobacteriota bacterium]
MERFYSLLLWLYPRDLRRRFAGDMRRTFRDLLERERDRGAAALLALALREAWQIFADALGERLRRVSRGRIGPFLESLARDVRLAARGLKAKPGLTAVVVLTLALAVGANTSVFSVVHAVLLQPLPFPQPEQLVTIWEDRTARGGSAKEWMEWPVLQELKQRTDVLAAAGVYELRTGALNLNGPVSGKSASNPAQASQEAAGSQVSTIQAAVSGQVGSGPLQVVAADVSAGFLEALSLNPLMGRWFLDPTEDRPGAPNLVLLSEELWKTSFASRTDIVGRKISLDNREATVIGVLPPVPIPDLQEADLWMNLRARQRSYPLGHFTLRALGRLKPGITLQSASQQLNEALAGAAQKDGRLGGIAIRLLPLTQELQPQTVRQGLMLMLLAAGCLLLAGCANIAGLLLGGVLSRRPEMALRSALGGGRARLLRQVVTENLLLALLGGAGGWTVAWLSGSLLLELAPPGLLPPQVSGTSALQANWPHLHPSAALFALALSIMAGLLFGILPALHLSRWPASALSSSRKALARPGHPRLRAALVAGQVSLALLLLVASGLLVRSFSRLIQVDLGFDPRGRVAFHLDTPDQAQAQRLLQELPAALRHEPAIRQAALVAPLPLGGSDTDVDVAALPPSQQAEFPQKLRHGPVWYRRVSGGYFQAMGIPLLAGRALDEADLRLQRRVAVVSQETAHFFWPGQSPLGRRLGTGELTVEVVGVAGGVRHNGLRQSPRPEIYVPATMLPDGAIDVVVHSSLTPQDVHKLLREHLSELAPSTALSPPVSLQDLAQDALLLHRFLTVLTSAFAVLALLCALLGIASALTSQVQGRRGELGLRLALGARRRHLFTGVLARGLTLTAAGMLLGWALSVLLSEVVAAKLGGVLFRTTATDEMTYGLVSLLLAAVSLAASLIPAWQASRTDPLQTLRE